MTFETNDNYSIRFEISNNSSTIRFDSKWKNTIRTALPVVYIWKTCRRSGINWCNSGKYEGNRINKLLNGMFSVFSGKVCLLFKCFWFHIIVFSSAFSYNKRQLSRIYPKGGRVDSSNFMPQVIKTRSFSLLLSSVDCSPMSVVCVWMWMVLPRQPNSVSLLWQFDLGPSYSHVRGPARLGSRTDSISAVYSGPAEAYRKP